MPPRQTSSDDVDAPRRDASNRYGFDADNCLSYYRATISRGTDCFLKRIRFDFWPSSHSGALLRTSDLNFLEAILSCLILPPSELAEWTIAYQNKDFRALLRLTLFLIPCVEHIELAEFPTSLVPWWDYPRHHPRIPNAFHNLHSLKIDLGGLCATFLAAVFQLPRLKTLVVSHLVDRRTHRSWSRANFKADACKTTTNLMLSDCDMHAEAIVMLIESCGQLTRLKCQDTKRMRPGSQARHGVVVDHRLISNALQNSRSTLRNLQLDFSCLAHGTPAEGVTQQMEEWRESMRTTSNPNYIGSFRDYTALEKLYINPDALYGYAEPRPSTASLLPISIQKLRLHSMQEPMRTELIVKEGLLTDLREDRPPNLSLVECYIPGHEPGECDHLVEGFANLGIQFLC